MAADRDVTEFNAPHLARFADLLRQAEAGAPVQLTLCGERGAAAFHSAPRSLAQRFQSLFRPQRFMDLRNQL